MAAYKAPGIIREPFKNFRNDYKNHLGSDDSSFWFSQCQLGGMKPPDSQTYSNLPLSKEINLIQSKTLLTRASGYLKGVCSHSLNPYSGCGYGLSSCGEGCYVRFNHWVTRGREWGKFIDVKINASELYTQSVQREKNWAHQRSIPFTIFMSSATDPWQPVEKKIPGDPCCPSGHDDLPARHIDPANPQCKHSGRSRTPAETLPTLLAQNPHFYRRGQKPAARAAASPL